MMEGALAAAGVWSYFMLFALAAGESSAFLGLAVPGETFVLAAGALASRGLLQWPWLLIAVTAGAVLGDSIGYRLGKRFEGCHDDGWQARLWSCRRMEQARHALDRWGGPSILIGRFIGLLRPLVPFAAGATQMRYRSFLVFNVVGALAWTAVTLALGYYGDAAVRQLLHATGPVVGAAIIITLVAIALTLRHRWRGRVHGAQVPAT